MSPEDAARCQSPTSERTSNYLSFGIGRGNLNPPLSCVYRFDAYFESLERGVLSRLNKRGNGVALD